MVLFLLILCFVFLTSLGVGLLCMLYPGAQWGILKNQILKCKLQNKLSVVRLSNYISHFEVPCVCSICGLPLISSTGHYKRYLVEMHLKSVIALHNFTSLKATKDWKK